MKKIMKHGMLLIGTWLCCVAGTALAAEDKSDLFRAQEFNVDLFGSGSIGQSTLDRLSGSRIRDNGRLGAGVGLSYFFSRNFGVGADAYSEDVNHSFVDSVSANFIARIPLGNSGFSPYGFAGGGRQFDPRELWFGQAGAGMEFRFCRNAGVFVDGRYVFAERAPNYGLFRLGMRLAF